jgi:hypothetical protein
MSKLELRIDENKSGGKVISYHLMTKRGEGSFVGGGEIVSAQEMRELARALIAKADEIEEQDKLEAKLKEVLHRLGQYSLNCRLDTVSSAAQEIGLIELVKAIELYWQIPE